jgi:hypothetical protein
MQGDFGRTSSGLANQQRILQARLEDLKGALGQKLLPITVKVVGVFLDLIDGARKLGNVVSPLVAHVQAFTRSVMGNSDANEGMTGSLHSWSKAGIAVALWIRNDFLPAARRLGTWVTTVAIPAIRDFASRLWSDLQPALRQIADSFNTQIRPALESAIGKFREAWPTIQRVLEILGTLAGFILTKVVPVLIRFYAIYLASVIRVLSSVFLAVVKVIGVVIKIGAALIDAGAKVGKFVGSVTDKVGSLVHFFTGVPGKIRSATSGMFDGIKDAFRSAINYVIGGWNRLHFGIPSIDTHIPGIGTIGGGSFGVPQIPYLAKGGDITAGGSAIVGERGPELLDLPRGARVTPLARGGAGGHQKVMVEINLTGADDDLIRRLKKHVRVSGGGNVQIALGS